MTRTFFYAALAVATMSPRAFADPTAAELDAARQAFADGKSLHDKGDFLGAVEKFKESYKLSKNPLLLYNIALTMEEAGSKDMALLYYRKFITDAPADAAQRGAATERIKVLEKDVGTPAPVRATKGQIKPAGTYSAADFEHHPVEDAPPNQPLDITASVPEDSGFKVTLYYRTAGENEFNALPMRWRYKELIGRIPAKQLTGGTLQYYLECRDRDGTLIGRAGKSVTPNLISIDPQAKPRFYPDLTDDTTTTHSAEEPEEDPLHPRSRSDKPTVVYVAPDVTFEKHDGAFDTGSSKFKAIKWTSTVSAVALLGVSAVFYVRARNAGSSLKDDSTGCGAPPCRTFDSDFDARVEEDGRHDEKVFGWTFGFGLAAAAVATWYWHHEVVSSPPREDLKASTKPPKSMTAWRVVPAVDPQTVGAAAAVRF